MASPVKRLATTSSVVGARFGVVSGPKPPPPTIAPSIVAKMPPRRHGFRSRRAAVIFTACGAAIRMPCSGRYGRCMSNRLSEAVASSSMEHLMRTMIRLVVATLFLGVFNAAPIAAQNAPPRGGPPPSESRFSSNELLNAGHSFFGSVSRGLAQIVEKAVSQWGLPNGYILGEEAAGA